MSADLILIILKQNFIEQNTEKDLLLLWQNITK